MKCSATIQLSLAAAVLAAVSVHVSADANLPPGISSTTKATAATAPATSYSGPRISITAHDGSFVSPDGPSPVISWKTSGKAGGANNNAYDYDLGLDVQVKTANDISALPKSVWGRIATRVGGGTIGGYDLQQGDDEGDGGGGGGSGIGSSIREATWDLSARADVDVRSMPDVQNIDFDLRADCPEKDLSLKIFAAAGQSRQVQLRRIDFSQSFRALQGRMTFNPRFDVPSASSDVILTYNRDDDDDTTVQVYASPQSQKVTIARRVADGHVIAPTITSRGGISVQWRHNYDGNSVVTTLVPKENVNVCWTDGAWTCDIAAPIEGTRIDGMKVSVRRKMEFN